jgi:hypothetical protein
MVLALIDYCNTECPNNCSGVLRCYIIKIVLYVVKKHCTGKKMLRAVTPEVG